MPVGCCCQILGLGELLGTDEGWPLLLGQYLYQLRRPRLEGAVEGWLLSTVPIMLHYFSLPPACMSLIN